MVFLQIPIFTLISWCLISEDQKCNMNTQKTSPKWVTLLIVGLIFFSPGLLQGCDSFGRNNTIPQKKNHWKKNIFSPNDLHIFFSSQTATVSATHLAPSSSSSYWCPCIFSMPCRLLDHWKNWCIFPPITRSWFQEDWLVICTDLKLCFFCFPFLWFWR